MQRHTLTDSKASPTNHTPKAQDPSYVSALLPYKELCLARGLLLPSSFDNPNPGVGAAW